MRYRTAGPLLALAVALTAAPFALARAADEPKSKPNEASTTTAAPAGEKPISDRDLSLYPGSVFEVPDPPPFAWNATDPGENTRLPRAYPTAPPRIPHGIADFVPIRLASNACLDCHAPGSGAGAPELPASHRTDFRNAPGVVGEKVAGARYNCVSCHVPTSDAKPLRANSAGPKPAAPPAP
jgi:Nitrate reductase cytochrome c-type subunit (NapB)